MGAAWGTFGLPKGVQMLPVACKSLPKAPKTEPRMSQMGSKRWILLKHEIDDFALVYTANLSFGGSRIPLKWKPEASKMRTRN